MDTKENIEAFASRLNIGTKLTNDSGCTFLIVHVFNDDDPLCCYYLLYNASENCKIKRSMAELFALFKITSEMASDGKHYSTGSHDFKEVVDMCNDHAAYSRGLLIAADIKCDTLRFFDYVYRTAWIHAVKHCSEIVNNK